MAIIDVSIGAKELEQLIFNEIRSGSDSIEKQGLILPSDAQIFRNVDLKDYGQVDLVAVGADDNELYVCVYNIYSQVVDQDELDELLENLGGIYHWLKSYHKLVDLSRVNIFGFLIARSFSIQLLGWLRGAVSFIEWEFDHVKGLRFNDLSYKYYIGRSTGDVKIDLPYVPLKQE